MPETPLEPPRRRKHKILPQNLCGPWCLECQMYDHAFASMFLVGVLLFLLYYITIGPPITFPSATLVKITPGESPQTVADTLAEKHIIHSSFLFLLGTRLWNKGEIIPGEYFFPGPQTVLTIARRISRGDYELIPMKVTIPEGYDAQQISTLLANKIPDFDAQTFFALAKPQEGYLFPDTYFFLPGEDPKEIVQTMRENFSKQTGRISTTTAAFSRPMNDIVIMASLIEKEAPDMQNRRIIAGILWHRLAIGMPLQVDAVFPYIINKNSFQLTKQDLQTNSPYNLYIHAGLPPTAISNPGINAILAAATPIKTHYLYYLSDLNGNFHYSATYAGQLSNERTYLHY